LIHISDVIKFLIGYIIFIGLFIWIEGSIGTSILSASSIATPTSYVDLTWWAGLLTITSTYPLLNIIIFLPFVVTLIYILACWFRGVSP